MRTLVANATYWVMRLAASLAIGVVVGTCLGVAIVVAWEHLCLIGWHHLCREAWVIVLAVLPWLVGCAIAIALIWVYEWAKRNRRG